MAILSIITAPDPRLKQISRPVERVDDEVRRLMDDMLETMHEAPGVGLAAPQVGVLRRVIVADVSHKDEPAAPYAMANPEVIWLSDDAWVHEEGCLSLPDHYADVSRPRQARIRYLDRDNEIREIEVEEILSTCLQHEIDHLDGILFVDHISMLKRGMILRKLAKAKKADSKSGTKAPAKV